ncbi:MAG: alpha-galactosidase [Ruminococcaceae bacterium]|nr:alpha-galactosidase [Oscillospiraceae bacterium]
MENIVFGPLTFQISDQRTIALMRCFSHDYSERSGDSAEFSLCEFDIAGGITSGTNRMRGSAEVRKLLYAGHEQTGNVLRITQRSDIVEVISEYTIYDDTNAVRVIQTIRNISDGEICLEMANTFGLRFGHDMIADHKKYYFHKFTNARYTEAMPDVRSLYDFGMYWQNSVFRVENVGNMSSPEHLPQGILENREESDFLMFQIESYYDWFYEISFVRNRFHLQIGGPTARRHSWNKILQPGEAYTTVPAALAGGKSLNGVLAEMTRYRRHIKPDGCAAEKHLPSIYNEYMHYSWDDPFEERVRETAPYIAKSGCEYYVVDCGWHDAREVHSTDSMYKLFGTWYEDRGRFPDGIRATTEYVRSLGMKFGLWIAPEAVGHKNKKMLEYYGDECFFQRNGKKIAHGTEYLLDYRHPKVRDYMTRTLDRMIDEYGCDYIKFDGCPNPGPGTDLNATSLGDGLEKQSAAFLDWVKEMMAKHPDVIFEDCAGGGQRMDYSALSIFHLISTSDQTEYNRYPYITANIFASVLPEQAAVWSYPVSRTVYNAAENDQAVNGLVSRELVVINMVNAVLGRIHLASRIHLLDEEKQGLIREGIDFYNRITPEKITAVPYLPRGYARFGDTFAAAGLKTDKKVYLAVWNLGGERHVKLELPEIDAADICVAYPRNLDTHYSFDRTSVTVDFSEDEQARIFEITLA